MTAERRPATQTPLLEICVESLPEAVAATDAGADRLELCGSMAEAGITPSFGLIETVVERCSVPVFVMIRPRGGDFLYDDAELTVMMRDIMAAKKAGAHGIVSGVLNHVGLVDREATRRLVECAAPLPFTFHRAIDLTPDLMQALDTLGAVGVSRVLTSGGASSASVGAGMIANLVRRAASRIMIIAGGSVRADNVEEIVERTGVREVHARPVASRSVARARVRDVRFGSNPIPAERSELEVEGVRALARALR
jgi:copper homeostasis protein